MQQDFDVSAKANDFCNGFLILRALYQLNSPATQKDVISFISVWSGMPRDKIQYDVMMALKAAVQAGFLDINELGSVQIANFDEMLRHKNNAIVFKALAEICAPATVEVVAAYVAAVTKVDVSVVLEIVAKTLEMAVQYGFLGKLHGHFYVDYDDLPLVNAKLYMLLHQRPMALKACQKRTHRRGNQPLANGMSLQQKVTAKLKRFTCGAKTRSRISFGAS